MKPYRGITGFTQRWQASEVLDSLFKQDLFTHSPSLFMVGVLASYNSLNGSPSNPCRYPEVQDIRDIFPNSPYCLNLVHYNSRAWDTLYEQLCSVYQYGGKNCHGLQLNIAWPPHRALDEWKKRHPRGVLVLQCGYFAMGQVNSPVSLAKRVKEYEEVVDYVLIDPSGGRGEKMNIEVTKRRLDAFQDVDLQMGVGIAGGLSAENLDELKELIHFHPGISVDAEGALRDASDQLDIGKAKRFVQKAFCLLDPGY